jgi:hypothetical protein
MGSVAGKPLSRKRPPRLLLLCDEWKMWPVSLNREGQQLRVVEDRCLFARHTENARKRNACILHFFFFVFGVKTPTPPQKKP